MAQNVITEVAVTEDGLETAYAAECPSGERADQFLYKLIQDLISPVRNEPILRIANTSLTIDRRNVTSITLTVSL